MFNKIIHYQEPTIFSREPQTYVEMIKTNFFNTKPLEIQPMFNITNFPRRKHYCVYEVHKYFGLHYSCPLCVYAISHMTFGKGFRKLNITETNWKEQSLA